MAPLSRWSFTRGGILSRYDCTKILQLQMLISILVIGYAVVINGQDKLPEIKQKLTEIKPPRYIDDGTTVILCTSRRCINASLASYNSSGVFVPETEQKAQTGLRYRDFSKITTSKLTFSVTCGCCKTYQYFTFYHSLIRNTARHQCYIIHLPTLRQYTTVGVCSTSGNNCMGGKCRQKYAYRTLLAWCPTHFWGLKFHLFRLPSHCACE